MKRTELERILQQFVPEGAVEYTADLLVTHRIQLKISKPRQSKFGDYRLAGPGQPHFISVNRDLNPYHFLITFLHEVAHLENYLQYGRSVKPHGDEWKKHFQYLGYPIFEKRILPQDVHQSLFRYLANPKASSCSDPLLIKTLKKYDLRKEGVMHVDEVPFGIPFIASDGRTYVKNKKLRSRYQCTNLETGLIYFVPGLMECKLVE